MVCALGEWSGGGTVLELAGLAAVNALLRVAEVAGGVELPHLVGVDVVAAALVRARVGLHVAVVEAAALAVDAVAGEGQRLVVRAARGRGRPAA